MKRISLLVLISCICLNGITAQDNPQTSTLKTINITISNNEYYTFRYKDTKPEDVPQEIYDGLWEIHKEVIDNFTYDYDVMNRRKKSPYLHVATKEDYYLHGSGVCENYSDFFILLAHEKSLTENLYKVSGKRRGSGHAWLEYRTEENTYIIDPTWSDDYFIPGKQTRQNFKESPAYGRRAFFITYAESKIIFRNQGYNHSSYIGKTESPL